MRSSALPRCIGGLLSLLALSIASSYKSTAFAQSSHPAEASSSATKASSAKAKSKAGAVSPSSAAPASNLKPPSVGSGSAPASNGGSKAARVLESGSAQGLVRNIDNSKVVTEARVVVRHAEGKHEQQDMLTNSEGVFAFKSLPAGDWVITVTADGMFAYSDKFTVLANESKQLKIEMESVEGYEILRITGKRTLIHPDQIGSRTHINKMLLHDIGDGNNLQQVLNTTPGVLPDTAGNIIVRGEHNALNYVVDGAILPEAAGVLQQAQFASPRSLQSVDVDIGGYQARDGGGPLGAVVRMKSMPVQDKPVFDYGSQLGSPLNGGVNYYASSALSQDKNSKWNRVAAESSGSIYSTLLGTQAPTVQFRRNGRLDMNLLSKVVYRPTDKDTLKLILGINETFMHQPTPVISANVGVKLNEHDAANYLIGHYNHQFSKWFDQSNFYVVNSFYTQKLTSSNVFDPQPIINGDGLLQSVAPYGKRKNYALSLQGDISKTAFKSHHLLAGFLSEFRPVSTFYNGTYRNADTTATLNAVADANGQIGDTRNQINSTNQQIFSTQQGILASSLAGDTDTADALTDSLGDLQASLGDLNSQLNSINPNPFPLGQVVSPFTGQAGGPQLQGNVGKFKAFRLLQSAYLQDSWTPN
ncbi:MAG: TonB-dependent receptor, partial [Candidatus Obscuribacterales bacterium]|nr:TonB-dependent receptor [Candidatus Obscuribacterales bacterium]